MNNNKDFWYNLIEKYITSYSDEDFFKLRILNLLNFNENAYERVRLSGHLTASAFIIDNEREHIFLLFHKKLEKWLQPGGHADGEVNLYEVAKKEVLEETGISISKDFSGIFDLDIHIIPERKGVQAHEHFDIRFLFTVDKSTEFRKNHESLDMKWIPLNEIQKYTQDWSILRMVKKL